MEISCPFCSQRLRVKDGLADPLCRCPSCRNTFRAAQFGYSGRSGQNEPERAVLTESDELEPAWPAVVGESPAPTTVPPAPEEKQSGGWVAGKIGTIIMLIAVGARVSKLWRNKPPRKPPPPPPQQVQDDRGQRLPPPGKVARKRLPKKAEKVEQKQLPEQP